MVLNMVVYTVCKCKSQCRSVDVQAVDFGRYGKCSSFRHVQELCA